MPIINFPSSKKIANRLNKSKPKLNGDIDYFTTLPPEMIAYILSWLEKYELPNLLLVNKNFHGHTKDLLLGKTYFQARSFLTFHHKELKQKTHTINRYLSHNKMHLFSGNRGMSAFEKSEHVFHGGASIGLLLQGIRFLLDSYLNELYTDDWRIFYKLWATFAFVGAIVVLYMKINDNKFYDHRLMSTTVTAQDLDRVSLATGLNLALATNASVQEGVTTLAQYETVIKAALSSVTLHTDDIETAFKLNPCTGKDDFKLNDLRFNAPINQSMANYMDSAFQIWKKHHAPNDEVFINNQSSHGPSQ